MEYLLPKSYSRTGAGATKLFQLGIREDWIDGMNIVSSAANTHLSSVNEQKYATLLCSLKQLLLLL